MLTLLLCRFAYRKPDPLNDVFESTAEMINKQHAAMSDLIEHTNFKHNIIDRTEIEEEAGYARGGQLFLDLPATAGTASAPAGASAYAPASV